MITGEPRQAASRSRSARRFRLLPRRLRRLRPGPAGHGRSRETAAWAAGTAVAVVGLFTGYLLQSRTVAAGSDGASQALQAWDLLHGNVLLSGWWVTDVSFYTTEIPQYAAIELVHGLSADVMHVAGAMTYTLLVLTAAFLARGRATGAAGLSRALLAAGIMLAPQLGAGTQTLVLSPDHTGTSVPVLLCWLLIDRAPRRWYVPALVWLGLAWTAVADAMTLFVAIVPLAIVCAVRVTWGVLGNPAAGNPAADNTVAGNTVAANRAAANRAAGNTAADNTVAANRAAGNRAAGRRARGHRALRNVIPLYRPRYELALLAAAVLAIPAELAATALIRAAGGWQVHGLATSLGSAGRLAANTRLAGQGLLLLFGANVFGGGSALTVAFAAIHLAGVALATAAVVTVLRRLLPGNGPAGLIESVLLAGIVVDLAGYLAGVQAVNIFSTREIAPVLPFAAVLAGRVFGDRLAAGGGLARALRYGLCAVLALYALMLGYGAAQPPAAPQYATLAGWLRAQHLTDGLSGYHQANIVTLESGGQVTLRAVAPTGSGRVRAYAWNASLRWFDPSGHAADFLVLTPPALPDAAGGSAITVGQAVATFGQPAQVRRYHAYTILIWPRGENLLARLR